MSGLPDGTSSFNNQIAVLEYLDQTGTLKSIKAVCQYETNRQSNGVYRFVVPVEPTELADLDAELGNLILRHPLKAAKIFQEIIYISIKALKLLPCKLSCSQILVHLRINSVPSLPAFEITSFKDFTSHPFSSKVCRYRGIICGMTSIAKYTQSARYNCSVPSCTGAEGNRYIRLHTPGAKEAQTVRQDFKCMFCGALLEEDVTCRILADKAIIDVVSHCSFKQKSCTETTRFQALSVILRDELVEGIDIGQDCSVIGLPLFEQKSKTVSMEAFSIMKGKEIVRTPPMKVSDLPQGVLQLYEDNKNSYWNFSQTLAYIFADDVTPAGTFLHLKLGLLLSLVSDKGSQHNLLALGCNTLLLSRLLHYAASFASRCVVHSACNTLIASVNKNKYKGVPYHVEGGSLLLAQGGVCLLDDLSRFKKSTRQSLQKVLESGEARVEVSKSLIGGLPSHLTFPIQCKVWAYTDPASQTRAQHHDDLHQAVDMGNISKTLTDVFGMVYFCDEAERGIETYADCLMIHKTLMDAMQTDDVPKKSSHLTVEEFQKLIDFVQQQEVTISAPAEKLISSYYVASRRVQAGSHQGAAFPLTAMKTVTSASCAHAKLSLRREVVEEDAVMAILLYEESIMARFGHSLIGVESIIHIKDNNIWDYMGPKNDARIKQFHLRLLRFCAAHAGDTGLNFHEE